MPYTTQLPILDDDLPEDDIDRIFSQLEPIEPPPSFIAHVLSQIAAYAPTLHPSLFAHPIIRQHELDNWTVQQKKRSLC